MRGLPSKTTAKGGYKQSQRHPVNFSGVTTYWIRGGLGVLLVYPVVIHWSVSCVSRCQFSEENRQVGEVAYRDRGSKEGSHWEESKSVKCVFSLRGLDYVLVNGNPRDLDEAANALLNRSSSATIRLGHPYRRGTNSGLF